MNQVGGDILLALDENNNFDAGLNADGNDVALDSGLGTAISLCLFCDARALDNDVIPDGTSDRRGWWADSTFGSRLWLLERSNINDETIQTAQKYILEALQILLDNKVADSFNVAITQTGMSSIKIEIEAVWQAPKASKSFSYFYNWQQIQEGRITNAV